MKSAKWKNDGLNKAKKKLDLKKYKKEIIQKSLEKIGELLRDLLEERSPKKSGKFASEWYVSSIQDNKVIVSNPDGEKFTMLEFTGRRPSKIEAAAGGVLHFEIGGEDIFVSFVFHSGFQASPFARKSLDDMKGEAKKIIIDVIREVIPFVK